MDSKIELIFQKKILDLENVKSQLHAFSLFQEGNIIINKISGNKYLQYNDTYLTTVWSPLEKLNLENNLILWR
jgi:hypothetical protein